MVLKVLAQVVVIALTIYIAEKLIENQITAIFIWVAFSLLVIILFNWDVDESSNTFGSRLTKNFKKCCKKLGIQ